MWSGPSFVSDLAIILFSDVFSCCAHHACCAIFVGMVNSKSHQIIKLLEGPWKGKHTHAAAVTKTLVATLRCFLFFLLAKVSTRGALVKRRLIVRKVIHQNPGYLLYTGDYAIIRILMNQPVWWNVMSGFCCRCSLEKDFDHELLLLLSDLMIINSKESTTKTFSSESYSPKNQPLKK